MNQKLKQENKIRELIVKVANFDDQIAFRDLFNLLYPRLLNFAQYYLESKYASNEVISTLFIGLWNNRKKLEKISRFENYIFKATRNHCLNSLRDKHRLRYDRIDEQEINLRKSIISPEDHYINMEMREKILIALDKLPKRCRLIFELIKDEGMKYKEVAELLNISVKTVENQMGKAYAKLRNDLVQYQGLFKGVD